MYVLRNILSIKSCGRYYQASPGDHDVDGVVAGGGVVAVCAVSPLYATLSAWMVADLAPLGPVTLCPASN